MTLLTLLIVFLVRYCPIDLTLIIIYDNFNKKCLKLFLVIDDL